MASKTISYSAWKNWHLCPFRHKLIKIDGINLFNGNAHSSFGKAMHSTSQKMLELERDEIELGGSKDDSFSANEYFLKTFREELLGLDEASKEKLDLNLIKEMKVQGVELTPLILPAMKEAFGNYKLVSCEQEINSPLEKFVDYDFHGFIDLVIQTEDGKYHIIDWKTCSWGWDMKKRTSIAITYQLTFYKHFFCKMTGADPNDVETHFGLIKRTASKHRIEIFRVTSGAKKVNNALNILDSCVINITRGNFIKNRLSCGECDFHKTIHCP